VLNWTMRIRKDLQRAAGVLALSISVWPAVPLHAAEIEEIVVTAEKRESALQDTPIAITAVTRDTLEVRGIDDFAQLQFAAPALVFAEIADMAQITMRGIGVDISTMDAEPGVALYSDGVYRGGLTSSSSLLFDLERIEVLRGPQGTLYGRNSTGGSLNVISRLPGEEAGFDAAFLYGDYDRTRVELSGDAPLVPGKLSVRGAFAYDAHDGYTDNEFTGREEDDADSKFGKVAAVWNASDTVAVTLRGEYTDSKIGGPPFIVTDDHPVPPLLLSSGNPGGILSIPGTVCGPQSCADLLGLSLSPPGVGSDDPRNIYSDGDTEFNRESWGVSATIDWDISEQVALKSITSYFHIDHKGDQVNNDGVDIAYLEDRFKQKNEEWSQEFTLSGSTGKLDWIGGAYYYHSDINEAFRFDLPALQSTFEALFGLLGGGGPLPPGSLAFFGNRLDNTPSAIPFLDFQLIQELQSVAVYGQGTWHFSDRVRGTAGIRWTRDEKDVTQTVVNNIGGDFCRDVDLDNDWSEVTGKVGLDVDVGQNSLVYAAVSTGFKAGGFNGGQCNNPYDPEKLTAYEIGSKSRFLDNTLQLNLSAFYYNYKDLQARLFINNASIVQNAADAKSYGFEAEWLWLVGADFRIDGSLSLLSAEFKDFLSTDPLNPQIGMDCNPVTGLDCLQDLSGNDLLRAPATKVSMTAEYDLRLGGAGTLTVRGEYAFTDKMYHTVFNNDFARQDSYSLWNARLIWTPPEGTLAGVRVIAFMENIGDEDYVMIHAPNATTGGTLTQYGPPRTWGLQVRYSP